ncbi:hypothetical protein INT43_003709 [Umbelopsis isabellina]|uniref:P-loop containing nucleoside triphosphate hydrolase protein n=1 Tax=Mortierella isabellina TaxID=91625 RepID=A0A8H7PTA0_MORIS|nr:hypothetical protein INT43_003709 [Umbelopsis isabellina]
MLFYTIVFSASLVRLRSVWLHTTVGVEKVLAPVYTVLCTLLFFITLVQPQEINPKNFVLVDNETLEITADGKILKDKHELSPETWASIGSWAVFEWMTPLVLFGNRQALKREDVYTLGVEHRARWNFIDFQDTLKRFARTSVAKRMIWASIHAVTWQVIMSNATIFVSYSIPFFLQRFLEYLENPNGRPISTAYFYVFMMFVASLVKMLAASVQLFYGRRWNIRAFNQLDAEIFAKTLKGKDIAGKVEASKKEKKDDEKAAEEEDVGSISNVGKITNLMSVDADRLGMLPSYIQMFYNSPVEISISLLYLYQLLGAAALIGLVVMLMSFPVAGWLSVKLNNVYTNFMTAKDKRNELTNELLQGIRMVKFFAWEKSWTQKVNDARAMEIKQLWKVVTFEILFEAIYMITPTMVTVVTFIWYTKVAQQELTASTAFVAVALFDMLRNPLLLLPDAFSTFSEAYTSMKRIADYLDEDEVKEVVIDDSEYMDENGKPQYDKITRTGFEQEAAFQWHVPENKPNGKDKAKAKDTASVEQEVTPFTLRIPELEFPVGELSIVCGPTGSGKTSLLYALLGEMDCVNGKVHLPSKLRYSENFTRYPQIDPHNPELRLTDVAFVSQTAFLQHASIRDNILFGENFEAERYKKVLRQCALAKDLSVLSDGDRTEIGEKGISLSGGQKQRVALARAVYSRAKTVLLDDCLSAVDSHTAKHLYNKCLLGDLMKGRTVVLVTHHVKLCLPRSKYLVKLENGSISGCGFTQDLRDRKILQELIGEDENMEIANNAVDIEETGDESEEEIELESEQEAKKLIEEEASEEGRVKFQVYKAYFDACGGWTFWSSVIALFVITRLLFIAQSYWIRVWAAAYATSGDANFSINGLEVSLHSQSDLPMYYMPLKFASAIADKVPRESVLQSWIASTSGPVNVDYYIGLYVLICFTTIVIDIGKAIMTYRGSVFGAQVLFHKMLDRIVHAPMRFFDTTPVGRILNRFGKDIATIDTQLARNALVLFECSTGIIAAAAVMVSVTPLFIFACLIVSVLYLYIGKLYLTVSREFKRLNSVSRSPIYSHFSETLVGVSTIRAYGAQERFMQEMLHRLDTYTASFYLLWMSNRWLYCRIEMTGAIVTLAAGIFIILQFGTIDAGLAGLSLTFSRSFLESVYWFVRQYTQVEMNLNSVERVQEYLVIDQEPPYIVEDRQPAAAWPTTAAVEIKDLTISYAKDLDPVLKDVSFNVRPHEKVGVVGRTGSGKSTLALSLFRFVDPSSGHIKIDGVDITEIGIESLRSKLTIIPQDAILFSGTIRTNLDPLGLHSDEALWDILVRVHLVNHSPGSTPGEGNSIGSSDNIDSATAIEEDSNTGITSLDAPVSDGGHNFSQGQRQLLCMARALLRNSRLIIMDEATASVDYETDRKIQITIREEFSESTLLCIAHRLRTIIDYDRVLVLDQGTIAEFDTPYNLLCTEAGVGMFKAMCEKSGEMDTLIQMATTVENRKKAEREQGIEQNLVADDFSRYH